MEFISNIQETSTDISPNNLNIIEYENTQTNNINEQEFIALVYPHRELLLNYAIKLTNDPDAAEDLVQETLIKAYRFLINLKKAQILKDGYTEF
ncbi:MAG TPA: sigma factor [Ignavibacteriales bacterium]|nr:sigma factor [Ignavibacteriales bacterium]HOL80688.1 sigma factor [Ignavibacteriales bacterium]HPP32979.1 sigma factor [Ignavibacteriales bacterium]